MDIWADPSAAAPLLYMDESRGRSVPVIYERIQGPQRPWYIWTDTGAAASLLYIDGLWADPNVRQMIQKSLN